MSKKDISYRDESYPAAVPTHSRPKARFGSVPSPPVSKRGQPASVVNNGACDDLPGLEMVGSISKIHRAGVFADVKASRDCLIEYPRSLQSLKKLDSLDLAALAEVPRWIPVPCSHPAGMVNFDDTLIDTAVAILPTPVFLPSLIPTYKNQDALLARAGLDFSSPRSIDRRQKSASRRTATKALRRKENAMAREIKAEPKSTACLFLPPVSTLAPVNTPTHSISYGISSAPTVSLADTAAPLSNLQILEKALALRLSLKVQLKNMERAYLAGAENGYTEARKEANSAAIAEVRTAINKEKQQASSSKKVVFERAPKEFVPHVTSGPSKYTRRDCAASRYSRSRPISTSSPSVPRSSRFSMSFHKSLLDAHSPLSHFEEKKQESRSLANTTTHRFIQSRVDAKWYTDGARSKALGATSRKPIFPYEERQDLRNDLARLEGVLSKPVWHWNQSRTFNYDDHPAFNKTFRDDVRMGPLDVTADPCPVLMKKIASFDSVTPVCSGSRVCIMGFCPLRSGSVSESCFHKQHTVSMWSPKILSKPRASAPVFKPSAASATSVACTETMVSTPCHYYLF